MKEKERNHHAYGKMGFQKSRNYQISFSFENILLATLKTPMRKVAYRVFLPSMGNIFFFLFHKQKKNLFKCLIFKHRKNNFLYAQNSKCRIFLEF